MKKQQLAAAFSLLLATAYLTACTQAPKIESVYSAPVSAEPESVALLPEEPPQPVEHRVRFSAVGDNLIHSSLYKQAAQRAGGEGYDFAFLYEQVKPFFAQFDVNWMNQESLITDMEPSNYPTFSTPTDIGEDLYNAGWRVFTLSNNHTYDKGAAGIAATRRFWQSMPEDVRYVGLYEDRESQQGIVLHEVNGLTMAYLAFTESTNGIPTPGDTEASVIYTEETETMRNLVQRARQLADAVIVGVHWGVEYSHSPTDAQRALAANFTEWGADVVIGTHPHVMQPIEWVESGGRKALVAYSLGNFASAQDRAPRMVGLCLTFEMVLVEQPDGQVEPLRIEAVQAYPTVTHYDGGFANNRTYMLHSYTEELAQSHGVRSSDPQFSIEWIWELCRTHISSEFIVLPQVEADPPPQA